MVIYLYVKLEIFTHDVNKPSLTSQAMVPPRQPIRSALYHVY